MTSITQWSDESIKKFKIQAKNALGENNEKEFNCLINLIKLDKFI